jgi:hypothetical protein
MQDSIRGLQGQKTEGNNAKKKTKKKKESTVPGNNVNDPTRYTYAIGIGENQQFQSRGNVFSIGNGFLTESHILQNFINETLDAYIRVIGQDPNGYHYIKVSREMMQKSIENGLRFEPIQESLCYLPLSTGKFVPKMKWSFLHQTIPAQGLCEIYDGTTKKTCPGNFNISQGQNILIEHSCSTSNYWCGDTLWHDGKPIAMHIFADHKAIILDSRVKEHFCNTSGNQKSKESGLTGRSQSS